MSQSRLHSLYETFATAALGVAANMVAAAYVFPFFGVALAVTQNLKITVFMTAFNIALRYPLRRLFNRLHARPQ